MQIYGDTKLFSPSDLINYLGCPHATFLDLKNLDHPVTFPPDDDHMQLLQEKGLEHEQAYLDQLRAKGKTVIDITGEEDIAEKAELTRKALAQGPDVVFQGAFLEGNWQGYSDFLVKVDKPSLLGNYSYEVADTKLSRSAKPKHLIQMCIYSDILHREQGVAPEDMHVFLGSNETASVRVDSVFHYFEFARHSFLQFVDDPPEQSEGAPCNHCSLCRWASTCETQWEAEDHLSLVAGLSRSQAVILRESGVTDLKMLAEMPVSKEIPGIQSETLTRLRDQARLQAAERETGERNFEILQSQPGKGLSRLPQPSEGDMFFDMEGDPLFEDGLEYLFGIITVDDGVQNFHTFWAHDRDEEKRAFQNAMDFMVNRLAGFPDAHVYHYASYEETALKRLAMFHGTREGEVDDLLRGHKLVDLYKVVREAIRTSEPGYSIKNMEKFYLADVRSGEVTTAGDSIVMYERWRALNDDALLDQIAEYNELDCVSTLECRNWLLSMRSDELGWYDGASDSGKSGKSEDISEIEARVAAMSDALLAGPDGDEPWRQLLVDLLEFHRRESKPGWWAMFARQEMDYASLLEDAECLAGLTAHPDVAPRADKRSMIHAFRFPAQDFKLKTGDSPKRAGSLEPAGDVISVDEDELTIELKLGPSRSAIDEGTSLIPSGPIGDVPLRKAVYRFAEAVRDGKADNYSAIVSVLRRDLPSLKGKALGGEIIQSAEEPLPETIEALLALKNSHLLIQGPPGAGKTYTASRAIVALLKAGKRIGVASNGHKAINQLVLEVESLASAEGHNFRGIKKSSRDDQMLGTGDWIEETLDNNDVSESHQLVAGTAWLFAREEHDQAFDYLFVDEAGQVGLANIVAMGVAARNIVLVGDQMQLSQPIQGTHPGGSGVSALQHLLEDHATVPTNRGVFLSQTRRMHPNLCSFVSAAVYDRRLSAVDGLDVQQILADPALDPEAIADAGLRFVYVDSDGCSQRSEPEAARLDQTYRALIGQSWQDKENTKRLITTEDILVVSPYNMQVELLKRTLPEGARVGTVDKFQGQEAAIVLISMATSSGDDLPRNIEFLYSRNRLNVAISRARCLSIIYANPHLLEISCNTIAQMKLVNGLCWAQRFAADLEFSAGD